MIVWLTSLDGFVNYSTEAETAEDAYHAFARSVGYEDWFDFCRDTGYSTRDVTAQCIRDERKSLVDSNTVFSGDYISQEDLIKRDESNALNSAYRWLLRGRGG